MRVATALVLTVIASSAVAQVRVVRTISLSVPPEPTVMPDFDATFEVTKSNPLRVIVVAPAATPSPPPEKAERRRVMAFADRLAAYCARPGKDENSWLRVKGRRFYCPG
jgi:hypothetical protein